MIDLAPGAGVAAILAARPHPVAAFSQPWEERLAGVPDNASIPLAMSGPHPRAVGSYGSECLAWAHREFGLTPRWWQAVAPQRQLEHDPDGVRVWRELLESGPRRIGKSTRLRVVAVWRTANAGRIGEPQLSMLVSKDLAVAKEIHSRSWRWAEANQWKVVRLNGGQEIETAAQDGRWLLRAENAVYGYDVGYGQVDEAWGVDPQAISEGLEPALLERLWPQLHLTSTAHARASSLMRRRLLAALREADPNVLLMLWGAPPDADFSSEAVWRAASPHWTNDRRDLIARKYAAALAGQDEPEFDDPDPLRGWAAQYLNVWPLLEESEGIFPTWGELAKPRPEEVEVLALGIASSPDHGWLSLGASIDNAPLHLALSDRRRGTERAEFVANVARIQGERSCPVLVRVKNFLIDDLEDAGVTLTIVDGDEFAQASTDLDAEVTAGTVEHGDYPDLNQSVSVASWRTVDNRRLIDTRHGDVSALESVALALRGARSSANYDPMGGISWSRKGARSGIS